jgi:hypothetical protein
MRLTGYEPAISVVKLCTKVRALHLAANVINKYCLFFLFSFIFFCLFHFLIFFVSLFLCSLFTYRSPFFSMWKTEINGRGDSLRSRDTLYPLKLALTSPTSGGRSVGIVRWRTKAPERIFLSLQLVSNFCL